jgi:branched-chain amino acid transport system permease protein
VYEALLTGTVIGSALALMALGLTLIFGVMRTINFAHGGFYTLGGYAFVVAASVPHLPPFVALLAAPIIGAVGGWFLHWTLLRTRPTFSRFSYADYFLIVTFAVAILIENGSLLAFGADYRSPPSLWHSNVRLFGFTFGADRLVGLVGALVAALAVGLYMRLSLVGRSWRAIAQNRLGAEVVGIDVAKGSRSVFAVACALAGLAGGLLGPLYSVYPSSGITPLASSFTIIVLGGMGSVAGAVIGGLIVGIVDTLGVVYISSAYSGAYAFALMILILLIRPSGLFGQRGRVI